MFKTFNTTCPTKDKTVSLVVNYISAATQEDAYPIHIKGRIRSCTGSTSCNNCELYEKLPQQI